MKSAHEKLPRPTTGYFHRLEWAFLGAPCADLAKLAEAVADVLELKMRVGWADVDHSEDQKAHVLQSSERRVWLRAAGGRELSSTEKRRFFESCELVLVNGQHFDAARQILVLDPKKADSVRRRFEKLTRVEAVVLPFGASLDDPLFDFLKTKIDGLPVFEIEKPAALATFLLEKMDAEKAPLVGLAIGGGRSVRMGFDKTQIAWHGQPQRIFLMLLLEKTCGEAFFSCRNDQIEALKRDGFDEKDLLPDAFLGLGPMAALLSFFQKRPDSAVLAVACDLPFFDEKAIQFLIENRDSTAAATAFLSPDSTAEKPLPEPLAAIWEPRSYPILLQSLAEGIVCPRKILLRSEAKFIVAPDAKWTSNANSPEDARAMGFGK